MESNSVSTSKRPLPALAPVKQIGTRFTYPGEKKD